jgi:hypothetical protein
MRKIPKYVFKTVISIVVFLVILLGLNLLLIFISNPIYAAIVFFINKNALMLIFLSILIMISDVFHDLKFPLNMPGPLFTAFAAVLLVRFIIGIFGLLSTLTNLDILYRLGFLTVIIYPVIFVITLIVSYVVVFTEGSKKKKRKS